MTDLITKYVPGKNCLLGSGIEDTLPLAISQLRKGLKKYRGHLFSVVGGVPGIFSSVPTQRCLRTYSSNTPSPKGYIDVT